MEIAIGIDELRWYGPTIAPFVIPMRRLFDESCVTVYSDDFAFIDFALRVGEAEGGVGVVKWNRRASSISLNVFLDVLPQQFPEGIQEKISMRMRAATTAFVAGIEKLPIEFKGEAFLAEVMLAIDEYDELDINL